MKSETLAYTESAQQVVLNPRYTLALNFNDDNLIKDFRFTEKAAGDDSYWSTNAQATYGVFEGFLSQKITANSAIIDVRQNLYIPTVQKEVFNVTCRVFVSADFDGDFGVGVHTFDSAKIDQSSWPAKNWNYAHADINLGGWVTLTGAFTVTDADAAYIRVRTTVRQTATAGYVLFDYVSVTRASGINDTDITYLTSHSDCLAPDGIAAIDRIDGCIVSISGQTQKISPDKAQHTIGSITLKILDVNQELSTKITTKLTAGEGLRQKKIVLYKGHADLPAWSDYNKRFTYLVDGVSYKNGIYTLTCSDIQRTTKTDIFEIHQGVLSSTISSTATTIPVTIASASSKFPIHEHDAIYSANASATVGYIKIDDEIICHKGWTDDNYTHLQVVTNGRGALNTLEVEHTVTATEEDQKKKVEEYIYLEMPVPKMIYAILTGLVVSGDNMLDSPFDLSSSDWTFKSANITVSSSTTPVNWGKMWNVEDDNASGYESIGQAGTLSGSNSVYTASIIIKHDATHADRAMLRIQFSATSWSEIHVAMGTSTVTTSSGGDGVIDSYYGELIGDYWVLRISAHCTGTESYLNYVFYPAIYPDTETGNVDIFAPFLGLGETAGTSFLPTNWHLAVDTDYVTLSDYTGIGDDLWNTTTNAGRIARFMGLGSTEGKAFIEKELLLWLGAYMPVYSDGSYGLNRLNSVLPYSDYAIILDESEIIDYGELVYDQKSVINSISIKWNWIDNLDRFTKTTQLIDSNSISKYNGSHTKNYEFKGVFTGIHSDADLQNYFSQIRDRYAAPPLRIKIGVMPKWDRLEVGDTVRVDCSSIHDFNADESLTRTFEIQQITTDWMTGKVTLDLFGGVEPASQTALSTGYVLNDTFYTSGIDSLTDFLTISSGEVTASGSLSAGTYCYDGDLTINSGVTVTINGTVNLRIKGSLVINGTIDGDENGSTGGTAGANRYGNEGAAGAVGYNKSHMSIFADDYGSDINPKVNAAVWNVGASYTPQDLLGLNIQNPDGLQLTGIPSNLQGTGGSAGDAAISGDIYFPTIRANGGAGGNSGAGLLIIARGCSFGLSGEISLNGANGLAGSTGSYSGNTLHAAPGRGGSGGGLIILIDGNASTPLKSYITTNNGQSPIPSVDVYGWGWWEYTLRIPDGQSIAYYVYNVPIDALDTNVFIGYVPKALNGYVWLPADEEQEVTGYLNKPIGWDEITDSNSTKPVDNASSNPIYIQASAPSHGDGVIWQDTTTNDLKRSNGVSWAVIGTVGATANESIWDESGTLISDTELLNTNTTWDEVSGTGKPDDNATWNGIYVQASAPINTVGAIWQDTTTKLLKRGNGTTWDTIGNAFDNTSDLTDGDNLGGTATWTGVTGTGKPANNATYNTGDLADLDEITTAHVATASETAILNENTTPADIGYTGALNATYNTGDLADLDEITTAHVATASETAILNENTTPADIGYTGALNATYNTGNLADLNTVGTSQIDNNAVTNVQYTNDSTTTALGTTESTMASIAITTTGSPVIVQFSTSFDITSFDKEVELRTVRDSNNMYGRNVDGKNSESVSILFIDVPPAGSHTYYLKGLTRETSNTTIYIGVTGYAMEIKK